MRSPARTTRADVSASGRRIPDIRGRLSEITYSFRETMAKSVFLRNADRIVCFAHFCSLSEYALKVSLKDGRFFGRMNKIVEV